MAVALEDLSVLLLWMGAFILASLAYYVAKAIASVIDIDLPLIGHPFHFVARSIENGIVGPLNGLRKASESRVAAGLRDLEAAGELAIGAPLVAVLGVGKALEYLWKTALGAFVHAITNPIRKLATKTAADVAALSKTVAVNLTEAKTYARARAADALDTAKTYTATKVADLAKAVRGEIAAAVRPLDDAVAEAAAELPALPGMVYGDLDKLLGTKRLWKLAGLIGSIPILAQMIRAIARDTGLENAQCRDKVKGICQTDPRLWEDLLATAFALGFAFDLAELAKIAGPALDELEPVIRKAA